ncbi:MAG: phosphoribosyltransferase [Actinomycetia bacterium]|nr:phosphoribosyltransferase [Actinomycetes bacterium]
MMFIDRRDAGRRLAGRLEDLRGRDVVILGLPRGGVPVAFEVARALGLPLDVIVVRKLGMPSQPELAMGAIGEGGVRILNPELQRWGDVTGGEIAAVERREQAELESRVTRLRAGRSRIPLKGRTAVIVDDGVATGSTARAACQVARAQGASQVVLAVPVAAAEAAESLLGIADEVVCLQTPDSFYAVGQWYEDFSQVPDEEVVGLLKRAAQEPSGAPRQDPGPLNSVPSGR